VNKDFQCKLSIAVASLFSLPVTVRRSMHEAFSVRLGGDYREWMSLVGVRLQTDEAIASDNSSREASCRPRWFVHAGLFFSSVPA